jgi:hypothetical protein
VKPTVRFFRHDGICRPMNVLLNHLGRSTAPRPGSTQASCKDAPEVPRPTHRRDEYRPVIPQRVARQHCPPPLHRHAHPKTVPGSGTMDFQRTVNSVLTVHMGVRPAKIHENESSLRTIDGWSGEVGQTVEKSRLFNCLIRSVRIERIIGRCLSPAERR